MERLVSQRQKSLGSQKRTLMAPVKTFAAAGEEMETAGPTFAYGLNVTGPVCSAII